MKQPYVNYDADGGSTTILDKIKNIGNATKELDKFSGQFKEFSDFSNIDDLVNKFPTLSEEVKQTAKDVVNGTKSMKDFDEVITTSTNSTSTLIKSLKSVGASVVLPTFVSLFVS